MTNTRTNDELIRLLKRPSLSELNQIIYDHRSLFANQSSPEYYKELKSVIKFNGWSVQEYMHAVVSALLI